MPFYERAKEPPTKGTATESAVQDFKREMSPKNHFTLANDVATFANHLGGTLWIGVIEDQNGNVGERAGIPPTLANELETAFSQAVKRRCKPLPIFDFERFPADVPARVVLAVFVEPYLGGELVGIAVEAREPGAKHEDPFVFPMRSGKISKYIEPGQLLMFTEPHQRRAFIRLSTIKEGAPTTVLHEKLVQRIDAAFSPIKEMQPAQDEGTFHSLDPARNIVCIKHGKKVAAYPLDRVKTVYLPDDGIWVIEME